MKPKVHDKYEAFVLKYPFPFSVSVFRSNTIFYSNTSKPKSLGALGSETDTAITYRDGERHNKGNLSKAFNPSFLF